MSKPPQKRLCWRMKEIRESVKIPFSDNRIACIARSLVTSRQERRAKRASIWANLADAGHVYTMAVIRQQSQKRVNTLLLYRERDDPVKERLAHWRTRSGTLGSVEERYTGT